jgi:tRNA nucleotidyltransferase (CCA-adding enzyme)
VCTHFTSSASQNTDETYPSQVDQAGERIQLYNTFVGRIEELDLPSAIDAKPILDVSLHRPHQQCRFLTPGQGREVVQALGVPKPGVWTGEVLSRVLQWQLEFPAGTKEECTRWLRKEQQAGRIVIDEDSLTKRGKPGGKDTRTKRTKT